MNKRSKILDEKTEDIEHKEGSLKEGLKRLETNRVQLKKELEKISGLSRDEAKEMLMKEIDQDLVEYEAKKIRQAQKNIEAVSYTHLDVYKRQIYYFAGS